MYIVFPLFLIFRQYECLLKRIRNVLYFMQRVLEVPERPGVFLKVNYTFEK